MQTAVAKANYNWARQLTNEWRVHSSPQLITAFPLVVVLQVAHSDGGALRGCRPGH